MRRVVLLILAVVSVGQPLAAQDTPVPQRQPFTPGPPVSLPPCTCRAAGKSWLVGETVCLKTPSGERLAICTTDENVTTWRISPVPCATSSLRPNRTAFVTQGNRC